MSPKRRKSNKFTVRMQRKLLIIFGVVTLLLIFMSIKMIRINLSKGQDYSKAVYDNFKYDSRSIPARRGDITDRNGTILAYSTKVYNLILDAKVLLSDEKYREPTVRALLEHFDLDEKELNDFIDENVRKKEQNQTVSSYKRLLLALNKEDAEPFEEAMNAEKSNIKGVWFEEEYKRTYPFGSLAGDVLGFASSGHSGELGIERQYNSELSGTNGRIFGYINDSSYEPTVKNAVNGNTVVTTIDYTIQNIVEEALKEFNDVIKTKSTSAVVMDPNTGEILAMADYPTFDLNNPRDLSSIYPAEELLGLTDEETVEKMYKVWSNYCVSTVYEPGSVFKTFTIAEALEEGLVNLKDVYTCDGEGIYNSAVIQCHGGEGQGDMTLSMALAQSCNDALMQIGMQIGAKTFSDYLGIFKFGSRTGIDLPSEENGLLKGEDMMDVDLATNSFGQNLNVTMVQMAANFASIINGGYYYQPHLLKEIRSEAGDTIKRTEPTLVTQTISSDTSAVMREMLRAVVEYGTGSYAYIDGYSIGGKTGTAEKADRDKSEYLVSFMGFAPAEEPEVLVYVVVDAPECEQYDSSWGAQLISRNIFKKLLPYMGIVPNAGEYDKDIYVNAEDLEETATKPSGPLMPDEALVIVGSEKPSKGEEPSDGEEPSSGESEGEEQGSGASPEGETSGEGGDPSGGETPAEQETPPEQPPETPPAEESEAGSYEEPTAASQEGGEQNPPERETTAE
ncbi:MAG: penicillin-binding transpeptidase domain-containing protein [Butyrivibrio sp.]|nr:penicillin-binding transpeptidase domain-containing protein [Butyrivibrio sp.]